MQFFSFWAGCAGIYLADIVVGATNGSFFKATDALRPADDLDAAVAVGMQSAVFDLLLPEAKFHFNYTTVWFAPGGYSAALPLIAEAEAQMATGELQWAYSADLNPRGPYPETSWRGRIETESVLPGSLPQTCDGYGDSVLVSVQPAAPAAAGGAGGDVNDSARDLPADQVSPGDGDGPPVAAIAAGVSGAVLVILLAAAAAALLWCRRKRQHTPSRAVSWRPSKAVEGGEVLLSRGTPSTASVTLDAHSAAGGSSMHGAHPGRLVTPGGSEQKSASSDGGAWTPVASVLPMSGLPAAASAVNPDGCRTGAAGADGSGSMTSPEPPVTGAQTRSRAVSAERSGSGSEVSAVSGVGAVRGRVAAAVQEMQGALQAELQEDQLKLYGVIGRGGFGTVYHGASHAFVSCIVSATASSPFAKKDLTHHLCRTGASLSPQER